MIISALAAYYEQLLWEHPDSAARPGWTSVQVKYQLVLSEDGALVGVIPAEGKRGQAKVVPEQVKRTAGVAANYLCDTSSYLLGIDGKGKPARALDCFEASKRRHHEILDGVCSPVARAILAFYDSWDPSAAASNPILAHEMDGILAGGNLAFVVCDSNGELKAAIDDSSVCQAWDRLHSDSQDGLSPMICLATGERAPTARLHPSIKGVVGAQSAGASLVSFNAPAFESYGHDGEQGRNSPVGARTAQAYGAALNYLLSAQSHHLRLGDTTVVYWSERADEDNCDEFALLLEGRLPGQEDASTQDVDEKIKGILNNLSHGKNPDLDGVDLDATFYVLGIAPNNSRLSVRFFLRDSFGNILRNIKAHYERIAVVHGPSGRDYLSPYWLLKSVENDQSKNPVVTSELSAPLLRAILEGGRYPEALYSNVLLRIRASRTVKYEHAAIIKGYLIRNAKRTEEEVTFELNRERNNVAYSLGRAFALLGQIQEKANGKDTLTGRFLDSACSTPAMVFPTLLKLASDHMQKIGRESPGLAAYYDKGLMEILAEGHVDVFPKRLSQIDQGDFMLGYYHQKAARYKKQPRESSSADEPEIAEEATIDKPEIEEA